MSNKIYDTYLKDGQKSKLFIETAFSWDPLANEWGIVDSFYGEINPTYIKQIRIGHMIVRYHP